MRKALLDIDTLKKLWAAPGYRTLWESSARKAVDAAFKAVAKDHHVTGWKPIRFSQKFLRETELGTPKLEDYTLSDLETAFWEQDVGWDTTAEAVRKIARRSNREIAPSLEEDQVLAEIGAFGNAWNDYQREYAMQKYGVDINFGN